APVMPMMPLMISALADAPGRSASARPSTHTLCDMFPPLFAQLTSRSTNRPPVAERQNSAAGAPQQRGVARNKDAAPVKLSAWILLMSFAGDGSEPIAK